MGPASLARLLAPALACALPQAASAEEASTARGHAAAELSAARCEGAPEAAAAPVPYYQHLLESASAASDLARQAQARRCLAVALRLAGHEADARLELEQSLALFERLGDLRGAASAHNSLGVLAFYQDPQRARAHFLASLAGFERLGDDRAQAGILANLVLVADKRSSEGDGWLARGLQLARRLGDAESEVRFLQHQGDALVTRGDLEQGLDVFEQALSLTEARRSPGSRMDSLETSILTSLGRLHRLHGAPEKAVELHRRALSGSERLGDAPGITQSLYMIGQALREAARPREALDYYDRALAMARASNSRRVTLYVLSEVASAALDLGDYRRAADVLGEVLQEQAEPIQLAQDRVRMAQALVGLSRPEEALRYADEALAEPAIAENVDLKVQGLFARARTLLALGHPQKALADAQKAIELLERMREQLVPYDFLKQGFAARGQGLFALAVGLLHSLGRDKEALETSELARSRAFLDLLATRRTSPADARVPAGGSPPSVGPPSRVHTRAASVAELVASARRLNSTVISYFVTDETTLVWVVSPDGQVRGSTLRVGEQRLAQLVADARGGDPVPSAAARPVRVVTRGGGFIWPGAKAHAAWAALHGVLVGPIRPLLPRAAGARLTIIPHGPLLLLPFGALRNPAGRYLIEDYRIHYAPAGGVLQAAGELAAAERPSAGTLVVADPAPLPTGPDGSPLQALPGSRREARVVAELCPGAKVLVGNQATEASFRSLASSARILHLATHGLTREDQPLESFLALGTGSGDGRLTANDVSEMRLSAELVVLSACRTSLGRVSADGILGLTRSFLAAGAAAIVATAWDVPDETATVELIVSFYKDVVRSKPKDEALRDAQLRLIGRLRAGRVTLPGPLGPTPVPEDPVLWAGFVLIGEP